MSKVRTQATLTMKYESNVILKLINVSKHFGHLAALGEININIERGKRWAIIGPNGAGKTTLFNVITGELKSDSGEIFYAGKKISSLKPNEIVKLGLARSFQRLNIFKNLTVFENVRLPIQSISRCNHRCFSSVSSLQELNKKALAILEQVGMSEKDHLIATELSYGEQRHLEIGIALATNPQLLLLDEPTTGMSPEETKQMVAFINNLPRDMTLVIIEHDMDVVFSIADRITVLSYGRVIAEGPPNEIKENQEVQSVYLGVD